MKSGLVGSTAGGEELSSAVFGMIGKGLEAGAQMETTARLGNRLDAGARRVQSSGRWAGHGEVHCLLGEHTGGTCPRRGQQRLNAEA